MIGFAGWDRKLGAIGAALGAALVPEASTALGFERRFALHSRGTSLVARICGCGMKRGLSVADLEVEKGE